MTAIQATNDFIRAHKEQALQSVIDFCSIPSISTLSDHKHDMERAAAWVADRLRAIGLDAVQVMPTGGHPVVYGENLRAHGQLTVLIYPITKARLWPC
jgi:acetylornithine deacetylase/succinyl-diaminopimelate desuccinylase-like protein